MKPETEEQLRKRIQRAIDLLTPQGFKHDGNMFFIKNGLRYDLSAADLSRIDYIVANRLMLAGNPECAYCDGKYVVEMDNNGPIGPCPICCSNSAGN